MTYICDMCEKIVDVVTSDADFPQFDYCNDCHWCAIMYRLEYTSLED